MRKTTEMRLAAAVVLAGVIQFTATDRSILRAEPALSVVHIAHTSAAPHSHDALGFELGRVMRGEIAAWARDGELTCRASIQRLRCEAVPVPGIADAHYDVISFRFDNRGRLTQIDADRRVRATDVAAAHVGSAQERLSRRVGEPTSTNQADAGTLRLRYGRIAAAHRYRDYDAELTATNFCRQGIHIHERFRWRDATRAIPDGAALRRR